MDSAWAPQDGEEWELRHDDDGFTYKILKRQRLTDPSDAVSQLPLADPKAEAKRRRERKRNTLLKLKNQYQSEIHKWEVLSNTLRSMQEKNKEVNQAALYLGSSNSSVVKKSEDSSGSLVDEFLLQVKEMGCSGFRVLFFFLSLPCLVLNISGRDSRGNNQ